MSKLTVTVTRGIDVRPKVAALKANGPKIVLKAANHAGGEIAKSVFARHGGGSGALARSFLPAAFTDAPAGTVAAGAFSDLVYAEIQDQGGTIKPKTGKNLAIPVGQKRSDVRWPRDYGKGQLHYMRSKSGKALLVENVGRGKDIRVRFVLRPQVIVRGSGYLKAAADAAAPGIDRIIAEGVEAATGA